MVRWRLCLVLAVLLLVPAWSGKSEDDDEEDRRGEEVEEEDDDDDDDDDETSELKSAPKRRLILPMATTVQAVSISRTTKKRPLECYVCAFKSESPLKACLDPTKYRVHTVTCHNSDDKCFTSAVMKEHSYEAVVRGCKSSCLGTADTTCCELNRCNNQAFAMPLPPSDRMALTKKSSKPIPNVLFFVTILLVLQTVVKVAFV